MQYFIDKHSRVTIAYNDAKVRAGIVSEFDIENDIPFPKEIVANKGDILLMPSGKEWIKIELY